MRNKLREEADHDDHDHSTQVTAHMTTAGRKPKNDNEEQVERRNRS